MFRNDKLHHCISANFSSETTTVNFLIPGFLLEFYNIYARSPLFGHFIFYAKRIAQPVFKSNHITKKYFYGPPLQVPDVTCIISVRGGSPLSPCRFKGIGGKALESRHSPSAKGDQAQSGRVKQSWDPPRFFMISYLLGNMPDHEIHGYESLTPDRGTGRISDGLTGRDPSPKPTRLIFVPPAPS